MGLDRVKKRYDQAIKNPAKVKEIVTSGGKKVKITTTSRTVTVGEALVAMEKDRLGELTDMGFSLKKLREAGFDADKDNPDDFCCDEYAEEDY